MTARIARWNEVTDRIELRIPGMPGMWIDPAVPIALDPDEAFAVSRGLREALQSRNQHTTKTRGQ